MKKWDIWEAKVHLVLDTNDYVWHAFNRVSCTDCRLRAIEMVDELYYYHGTRLDDYAEGQDETVFWYQPSGSPSPYKEVLHHDRENKYA